MIKNIQYLLALFKLQCLPLQIKEVKRSSLSVMSIKCSVFQSMLFLFSSTVTITNFFVCYKGPLFVTSFFVILNF